MTIKIDGIDIIECDCSEHQLLVGILREIRNLIKEQKKIAKLLKRES